LRAYKDVVRIIYSQCPLDLGVKADLEALALAQGQRLNGSATIIHDNIRRE
jgi:hypothetical protein